MDRESELKRRAEKYPFPIPEPARKKLKKGLDEVPTRTIPGQAARAPQTDAPEEGESHDETR